jgi:hypothetical protein
MPKSRGDYGVGFGRPPKETQFKKGRSGNPSGRRRGCKNLLTLIEAELESTIIVKEDGRTRTITKRAAWAKQLVHKAISGDPRATAALLKLLGAAKIQEDDEGRLTVVIEG